MLFLFKTNKELQRVAKGCNKLQPKKHLSQLCNLNNEQITKKVSYNALIRPLKNGNEYNSLFPTPKEKKVRLQKGDTHTSIELIIKWALENNHEVKLVAPKLKKGSLSETCYAIHDFLFNHFQYEADGEAQLLRSPAYAWKHRYKGIDCKSYSIIASCILLQLGIKHYIRKIKQPAFNPEHFTHVYVIVPVNQTTGSLNQGYYTIDGTLKSTQEPNYINKKDFFMDKLQHYGLNGTTGNLEGLNGFSYDDVKSAFSTPISCWGGSAFSGDRANSEGQKIGAYFELLLNKINNNVASNDLVSLSQNVNKLDGIVNTAILGYTEKRGRDGGWNKCTTESIDRMLKILEFYKKIALVGLMAWLNTYFDLKKTGVKKYDNGAQFEDVDPKFYFSSRNPANRFYDADVYTFTLKEGITQIPQFEFTPYVEQAASNPNSFDPQTFLQGLSNVLVSFSGNGTGTGTGAIDSNGQNIYNQNNRPKSTSKAGGLILGAIALGGLVWGFSKMKDTGKGSKTK